MIEYLRRYLTRWVLCPECQMQLWRSYSAQPLGLIARGCQRLHRLDQDLTRIKRVASAMYDWPLTRVTVLCSRFSKNPAARSSPSSQTPRQPFRGSHPAHQTQGNDTLSRSYNRHTTPRSNEESPSNSDGSQLCRHRRQREGRRVGKDDSTERTRLRATALRVQQHVPGPN